MVDAERGIPTAAGDLERPETDQLRLRATELREAQRIASIGSWTWDPTTDTATWSDELYRIYGLDPADPITPFAEAAKLYTPATFGGLSSAVLHTVETGEPYEVDIEIILPDGSIRLGTARGEAIRDAGGAVILLRGTVADITERRKAEQALRESEARYRSLFTHLQSGLAHCRIEREGDRPVDWTYLLVNETHENLTGLRDVVGRRVTELIPGIRDENPGLFALYGRVAAGGAPERYETYVPGLQAWYAISVFSPGAEEFVAIFDDITDRMRAEQQARSSANYARGLIEASLDPLVTISPAGIITDVNEATVQVTGVPRETLIGTDFADYLTEPAMARAGYTEVLANGLVRDYPLTIRDFAGRTTDVLFNATVYRDEAGEVQGVFAAARDVTERRRAEELARASAARDALLVDENTDGIIRVSAPRGRFQDANQAACTIFGRRLDELRCMDLLDLVVEDPPRSELVPASVVTAGATASLERTIRRADGAELRVATRIRQLPDGTYLATVRDVTRDRALEQQVEQAQRMESVGRLAGGIAHDFNNLLMAINGYVSLALDSLPVGDPLRPDLEAVREAGDRGAALTRQLLAFGRRQTLQPSAIDVRLVVAGLRSILTRLLGEDVTFYVRTDPGVGPVWADRSQLEQVIVNLVTNARDAMPDGGALAIETTEVEMGAGDPRLRPPAGPGTYVRLAVTDTGCGMDAATIAHIFEPFYTTKGRGRGTGLGLSTVEGVVAQSGGFISVESRVGRGTTFDVFLPRTARVAGGPDAAGRAAPSAPRGTETILLVEDEPGVRAVAGRMLRDLGYEVIEATGPTQALALAGSHGGVIDLLITDVIMPEMNGRALAERLATERPDLAILFMSGYSPESVFRDGYLDAKAAYLQKPFNRTDLATKVRTLLVARSDPAAVG